MCEQCVVNPYYWYDVLPGWTLIRARRKGDMDVGDFGLVRVNDPSMVWQSTPQESPTWADTAEERDNLFDSIDMPKDFFQRVPEDFYEGLTQLSTMEAYELVDAAFQKGYDRDFDGQFESWLWDYLGHIIHNVQPQLEEDGLPNLDKGSPHDYNYKWDM